MPLRPYVVAVVVSSVVVVPGRDDLASFDEDCSKTIVHRGLQVLENDFEADAQAYLGRGLDAV